MQCYEMGVNGTIDHLQEIYLVVHVRQKSQTMYWRMLRGHRAFPTTTYMYTQRDKFRGSGERNQIIGEATGSQSE